MQDSEALIQELLNESFLHICKLHLMQVVEQHPNAIAAQIIDTQDRIVCAWANYERIRLAGSNPLSTLFSGHHEVDVIEAGEGLSRVLQVRSVKMGHYVVQIPIFNLPFSFRLAADKAWPFEQCRSHVRNSIMNICADYMHTTLRT